MNRFIHSMLVFRFAGILLLIEISSTIQAQDYFSDRHATGNPIIFSSQGKNELLFSAGFNLSDNSSIKANLFRQYWLDSLTYRPLETPRHKTFLGWGLSAKASMVNGPASLFSEGKLDPAFNGGAYLAYSRLNWKKTRNTKNTAFSDWSIILSENLNYATYQFFDRLKPFDAQLSTRNFKGSTTALAYVLKLHPKTDNVFIGASVSYSRKSNYYNLNSVYIKDDSVISSGGNSRTVTQASTSGTLYAEGRYREYGNLNLRLNSTYIPAAFNYNIGFTLYPSVDFTTKYRARYNTGLALSYLPKGSPSTPFASIFFEFDDITNASGLHSPFIKRSFNIGLTTTLNLLSGKK